MPPCWTLSIIRYRSRVKRSKPEKGVGPSPIPRCSSYWKGSLRVTLDYGRQFYLLYFTETNAMVVIWKPSYKKCTFWARGVKSMFLFLFLLYHLPEHAIFWRGGYCLSNNYWSLTFKLLGVIPKTPFIGCYFSVGAHSVYSKAPSVRSGLMPWICYMYCS